MNSTDKAELALFSADESDTAALIKRIKYILKFYAEWMSNKDKSKEDMYSIINNGFGINTSYNLKSFLSDYHFVVHDRNRKLITTEIHKMDDEMKGKDTDTICDAEVCRVIDRSEIDRSVSRQAYFFNPSDSRSDVNQNVAIQQMLDSLHVFMYHTFRVHPTQYDHILEVIKSEEEEAAEDSEDDEETEAGLGAIYDDKVTKKVINLIHEAKAASSRFRRTRNASQIHNKFMTVNQYDEVDRNVNYTHHADKDERKERVEERGTTKVSADSVEQKLSDEPCVTDTFFEHLRPLIPSKDTLKQMQCFLSDEEYDTDAITDDLEFRQEEQSNLKPLLLNRFEAAALYVHRAKFEEYAKNNVYDAGVRFFYWPYFKDNEAERSLIYQAGSAYVYDWNRGYKLKDWYIPKKYDTLKEELTQNETKPFPIDAYDAIVQTATMKLNAYQSMATAPLLCRWTEWKKPYGIVKGDEIELKHIVALLCYTDFSGYCYEFAKSFRKISPIEPDQSLKQRHREFRHCARYLRECVEVFGDEMGQSTIEWFYHGISRSMLLNSTDIELRGPVSTTSVFELAVNRFATNGIVLQIRKNPNCYMTYWPCSYWSAFSEEYEYLYIGGLKYFHVYTIRDIPNGQRYDSLIRQLTVIHYMVDGYRLRNIRVRKQDVKIIRCLVEEEERHTVLKSLDSSVPIYFLNLFHHFLNNLQYVDINFGYMDKELCMISRGNKYNGFKRLVPIFCLNDDPDALNYALMCRLMPNVKSFVVWRFHQNGCERTIQLDNQFVSSIIEAIALNTKCAEFCIAQPFFDAQQSTDNDQQLFEGFIDKHQALFQKYGWTLRQDQNFQHPRRGTYPEQNALLIKKL
eukprot:954416_1